MTTVAAPPGNTVESKGLKRGALGLVSSVVVGLASTAPAYSLAATLGLVIATSGTLLAGVKAPAIMLISFTFVGDLGWHSVATLSTSTRWSTMAGIIWIALMTYICYRGIEVSARLQYVLLTVEMVVLIVVSVVALVKVYAHHGHAYSMLPALSWFWPGGMDFGKVVAPAVLATIFIYWGWDTAVACNEESDDPGRTPGRAAVISTFLLLGTYALVTVSAIAFAGVGTEGIGLGNQENAKDVFTAIGPSLFGDSAIGKIGMLLLSASILTSAAASTQTTIMPTARTTLSMGVYRALPNSFAKNHRKYLTPTTSTIVMGVVSALCYVLFTAISVDLLTALIGSVGLMIAFYYALTGFACTWFYRKTLTRNVRDFVMRGLLPLAGGVTLSVVFVYGLIEYSKPSWLQDENHHDVTIFGLGAVGAVGVVGLLLGLVLMVAWRLVHPDYFRGLTLPRRHDLVLESTTGESGTVTRFGLPDSGDMPTVIAPDLSNLPPGETAVDTGTGEEFSHG